VETSKEKRSDSKVREAIGTLAWVLEAFGGRSERAENEETAGSSRKRTGRRGEGGYGMLH